jgi:hypothetical protein
VVILPWPAGREGAREHGARGWLAGFFLIVERVEMAWEGIWGD